MLFEIKCAAFNENYRSIYFNDGLNVVLGCDNKANSIGKSTFLLAVDFAFGGNSYKEPRNKIVSLFGHHTVCFSHRFKDGTYYFSRSTEKADTVERCDENYRSVNAPFKLNEFTDFLKREENLENIDLSFREMVSACTHIAGNFETDFDSPLKIKGDTSPSKSILRFEKLFDEYEKVKPLFEAYSLAEKKSKTFSDAESYGFIKGISTKKHLEELCEELKILNGEMEIIKSGKARDLFEFEGKTAQEAAGIKKELKSLRLRRTILQAEIAGIQRLDKTAKPSSQDLQVLNSYFPDTNMEKIEAVIDFHSSLLHIVNDECDSEEQKLKTKLDELTQQISELESRIAPEIKDISPDILEDYAKKAVRIEEIQKRLKAFAVKDSLKAEQKEKQSELNMTQKEALESVSEKINRAIQQFDEKKGKSPLQFEFKTQKSYALYRKNDVGTGTKHLNLIIFNLAVLCTTKLPFLIHDSYIFHELEDERVDFVLSLYDDFCKTHNKQIFIAIDGQDKCNETSRRIIEKAKIIQLGKEADSLFGMTKN